MPLNKIYNDLVHNIHHTRLNSTKWATLKDFARYLESDEKWLIQETGDTISIAIKEDKIEYQQKETI